MPRTFDKLSCAECTEDSIETLLRKVLQEIRELRAKGGEASPIPSHSVYISMRGVLTLP